MQHTNMTCSHRFQGWVHSFIPSLLKHNVPPQYFIYADEKNHQKKNYSDIFIKNGLAGKHPVLKTRKITTSIADLSHNSTVGPNFPQQFFQLVDLDIRKYNEQRCYHKNVISITNKNRVWSLAFTQIQSNNKFISVEGELGS